MRRFVEAVAFTVYAFTEVSPVCVPEELLEEELPEEELELPEEELLEEELELPEEEPLEEEEELEEDGSLVGVSTATNQSSKGGFVAETSSEFPLEGPGVGSGLESGSGVGVAVCANRLSKEFSPLAEEGR